MKQTIVIFFAIFVSNFAMGQSFSIKKIQNIVQTSSTTCTVCSSSNCNCNCPSGTGCICPSRPGAPCISYYKESNADHSYSFTGHCNGATEYEWQVQPESNVEKIYYRGSNEILVIFKGTNYTSHIVCRAKCNGVWSDYTVGSVDIVF